MPRRLPTSDSPGVRVAQSTEAIPTPRRASWREALRHRRRLREVAVRLGRETSTVRDEPKELDASGTSQNSRIPLPAARRLRRRVDVDEPGTQSPQVPVPPVWGGIPPRNANFTGRSALLDQLVAELRSAAALQEFDEALVARHGRRFRRYAAPPRRRALAHGVPVDVRDLRASDVTRRFLRSMLSVLRRGRRTGGGIELHLYGTIQSLCAASARFAGPAVLRTRSAQHGVVIRGPTDPAPDMWFMSGVRESMPVS